MKNSPNLSKALTIRCGCRASRLSLIQTRNALARLSKLLPEIHWVCVEQSSPGDRDKQTDLRDTPADFFTRDLDESVGRGDVEFAIHSAKDVPEYDGDHGLEWFWLPWRESPEDVLVVRREADIRLLEGPGKGKIGVSSERRAQWCSVRFPRAVQSSIRGNISSRLEQLNRGDFDAVVVAAAALNRLNLSHLPGFRIGLEELPVPAGQGALALTYRRGDLFFRKLRNLLNPPVRIVGAGAGNADWISVRGADVLKRADTCLYDSLVDSEILRLLPKTCRKISVGKRASRHSVEQPDINRLLVKHACRGKTLVRLKGGDPGIFGRLAEEIETLEEQDIPYIVYPGLSAVSLGSTGTGHLLTLRGKSRSFRIATPIRTPGKEIEFPAAEPGEPTVLYMSAGELTGARAAFLERGWLPQSRCAVVYGAGTNWEKIRESSLEELPSCAQKSSQPGLVLIGLPGYKPGDDRGGRLGYKFSGPLRGSRVLLTCSRSLMNEAVRTVEDAGGRPVPWPLIEQSPVDEAFGLLKDLTSFDWLVLTSPASIRLFFSVYQSMGGDVRKIPRVMVCGDSSARVLSGYGVKADLLPQEGSGAEPLIAKALNILTPRDSVLRLRSDRAGEEFSKRLGESGARVEDRVFYQTAAAVPEGELPSFHCVFFASSSGADVFIEQWGVEMLEGKTILALGNPTLETLKRRGVDKVLEAGEMNVSGAFQTLKAYYFLDGFKEGK